MWDYFNDSSTNNNSYCTLGSHQKTTVNSEQTTVNSQYHLEEKIHFREKRKRLCHLDEYDLREREKQVGNQFSISSWSILMSCFDQILESKHQQTAKSKEKRPKNAWLCRRTKNCC